LKSSLGCTFGRRKGDARIPSVGMAMRSLPGHSLQEAFSAFAQRLVK
jgi:hypothetical protein